MDDHIYQKITNKEYETFNLYIEFEEDSFLLNVLQHSKAWKSNISKSFLQKEAEKHGVDVKEYYDKLKSYFKQLSDDVQLNFTNKKLTLNILLKNEMKYVYFSCDNTEEVSYNDCVMGMVDKIYSEKCSAVQLLNDVMDKTNNYQKRATDLESKLEEFILRKKTDEEQIYSKFLAILNEKKTQIQHLNELLIAFKHGRPTLNPRTEVKKRISKKDQTKNEVKQEIKIENNEESDSSTSFEDNVLDANYDTDDEKEKMLLRSSDDEVDKNMSSPLPTTSKQNFDILSDESPPRYHLPKRIKTNYTGTTFNINEPSTSRESLPNHKVKKETVEDKKTAVVDYDTQYLLDNL